MEPILRSAQVLKKEAEEKVLEGKDIVDHVRQEQALDREEKVAWRDGYNFLEAVLETSTP